jgi:hypothetical protein
VPRMGTRMRRTTTIVAVLTSVLLALAGTASAGTHEWGGAQRCASGEAKGQGGTLIDTFRFTVCQQGDSHSATGYFAAAGNFGTDVLVAPQGPVTCADITGDTVSFLYPLEGSRPPLPSDATAILIVATAGGPGIGKIGFVGPAPTATFLGRCDQTSPQALAARVAQLPLSSGGITVTDHA